MVDKIIEKGGEKVTVRKQLNLKEPSVTYNWTYENLRLLLLLPKNTVMLVNGKPLKSMKVIRPLDEAERMFLAKKDLERTIQTEPEFQTTNQS